MTIRSLAQEGVDKLTFDVLIIGSGPAGIAIATEFLSSNLSVAVIESGGTERQEQADSLNEFESVGQTRAPHQEVGCRVFGGSSSLWTGRCGKLDQVDFHARPWLPLAGWPIELDSLASYYQRAGIFLGLAPTRSAERGMSELRKTFDSPPFEEALFKPVVWQFSKSSDDPTSAVRHFTPEGAMPSDLLQHTGGSKPVRVGARFSAVLEQSRNVHVFTSATVSEIRADPISGSVTGATALTPEGTPITFDASRVVVACGGIQNARLLLSSRSDKPNGLGNDHDQVGRYLSDHTFTQIAVFRGSAGSKLRRRLGSRWHPQFGQARVHILGLRLSEEVQRRQELLNAAMHVAEYGSELNPLSTVGRGARRLKKGAVGEAVRDLASGLARPVGLASGAYDRMLAKRPPLNVPSRSVLGCVTEQELMPESRVTLSERTDRFGQPLARIDWRISEREFRTVRAVEEAFRTEAVRLGFDPYERPGWTDGDFDNWKSDLLDLAHPSCATRMSSDPATGVVDANCEVHGVRGLYVAGSSVFASNGYMNPTQTLVALALRLADHIKGELRARVPAKPTVPEPRRFRFGFVGGGHRVETVYAPVMSALSDEIEVCGVVTRSEDGAKRIAARTGWSAGTDLRELIDTKHPDALITLVPPGVNASVYPGLVDLGLPLMLETPFCWNERHGRKLLKKIEDRRLLVSVAEQFPFMPEAQLMQRVIALGLIGRVEAVVNDFACYDYHSIGFLRTLLGRERRPVFAQGTRPAIGNEHWLMGSVTCEDGGLLLHRFSPDYEKAAHRDRGAVRVYGSTGTLLPGEVRFGLAASDVMVSPIVREGVEGDLKSLSVETPDGVLRWVNPFFGHGLNDEQVAVGCLVRAMAEAVRFSGVPPYPAWAALEDVELINALRYSADRGGALIPLPASRLKQKALARARTLVRKVTRS